MIAFLLSASSLSYAQNFADKKFYLVDSLNLDNSPESDRALLKTQLEIFHNTDSDSTKVQVLEVLIEKLRTDIWIQYNKLAYEFCRKKLKEKSLSKSEIYFYKSHMAGTVNNMGYAVNNDGDSYLAAEYYLNAAKIFESIQDSSGMALTYINAAVAYNNVGDIKRSNEMDLKGIEVGRMHGDMKVMSVGYKNLSMKYLNGDKTELALENALTSLKYARLLVEDPLAEGVSMMGVGQIYAEMGNDSLASFYFKKALEIKKSHATKAEHAESLVIYGEFLRSLLQKTEKGSPEFKVLSDSCLNVQKNVIQTCQTSNQSNVLIRSYNELSRIYNYLGQTNLAIKYADLSYEMAVQSSNLPKRQKSARVRYEALKNGGRYKEAMEMLEEWDSITRELDYANTIQSSIQNKQKLDYQLRVTQDSLAFEAAQQLTQKEIENQNDKIKADAKQKWILYSGLFLIAVFSFFLFKKFRQTQHQNKLIFHQKEQIVEAHTEMRSSIEYAKRLQAAILPKIESVNAVFKDSFILFKPKDIVSGDFYWFEVVNNQAFIAAADCTGHGVPGAMVSVVCSNALHQALFEFKLNDPAEILNKTREIVIDTFAKSGENVKDGMDIALCRVDLEKNEMSYAGANNPLWLIRNNSKEIEEIKGDKQPVGLHDGLSPFKSHPVKLQKGDQFFLFTDGFADQFGGENGKKLKYKPFKKLLLDKSTLQLAQQQKELNQFLNQWQGTHEQLDDVCVIGVRV